MCFEGTEMNKTDIYTYRIHRLGRLGGGSGMELIHSAASVVSGQSENAEKVQGPQQGLKESVSRRLNCRLFFLPKVNGNIFA